MQGSVSIKTSEMARAVVFISLFVVYSLAVPVPQDASPAADATTAAAAAGNSLYQGSSEQNSKS